jgi:hypothetical protein
MGKVVINLVEEKKVKVEKNTQHVDLHQLHVKVKEKEKSGVKRVKMNL